MDTRARMRRVGVAGGGEGAAAGAAGGSAALHDGPPGESAALHDGPPSAEYGAGYDAGFRAGLLAASQGHAPPQSARASASGAR